MKCLDHTDHTELLSDPSYCTEGPVIGVKPDHLDVFPPEMIKTHFQDSHKSLQQCEISANDVTNSQVKKQVK